MENKVELKETDIENRACYYLDDTIRVFDTDFDNVLLDEKLNWNILVCDISYKTSTGPKPLHIRFDKINAFIRVLDGEINNLVLLDYRLFDKICDKIKYLVYEKSGITEIALIIILEKSELTHIIFYLLKKCWLFIMRFYSLNQLSIRIKITTAIMHF